MTITKQNILNGGLRFTYTYCVVYRVNRDVVTLLNEIAFVISFYKVIISSFAVYNNVPFTD